MFIANANKRLCLLLGIVCSLLLSPSLVFASDISEEYTKIPAKIDGMIYNLDAKIYRPSDDGVYPLIVLNHGRSTKAEERKKAELVDYYKIQAETLAKKGFVVVLAVRRGYGLSEGPDAEYSKAATIYKTGLEGTKDVVETVRFMQQKSYVDSKHTIIMGQSCGGLIAVASATKNIPGLAGVVNFAGGLRHPDTVNPDIWTVYDEQYLISTYSAYGRDAKVPMIWLYTENDSYFPPAISKRMFDSFVEAGGKAEFYLLPAFRKDGHTFFPSSATIPIWLPLFEKFLDTLNIPYIHDAAGE
ncbi:MAG: alpha/beta fold hydrolase [Veillonellales bacterium]